jgi:hypothetical protein
MIWTAEEILGRDTQKFPGADTLGEALQQAAKRRWSDNTAKRAEAAWDLNSKTAKNVADGVAGGTVAVNAVKAQQAKSKDAWELWLEMGRSLIGESLDEYEERKLRQIIEKTEHAKRQLEERRARRVARRASDADAPSVVALLDRLSA